MSLWLDQLPHRAREGVNDEFDVDIAIVGAGFTGLWTAYFLSKQNPAAKIVIDRKSTRLNSSHIPLSRMPSSA